ncbi:2-succinylbenzoate--CoA ligase [Aliterella atlantica]|uniref:O-succinylbenzoic acid--CoA ligase n=1 Tax=Aliterella atlantica CENA595 TaxID=1618023 RepID=A0A0D8ZMK0_9CYAN|nr:2-succinylbenzoate--CoA ligase [Aliterella atlantica]KJH69975.1 O-succinylbenzoic acid--CoA ligase [Aliterella atlantica CENA595]
MRQCIDYLTQSRDDWLIGCDRQQLIELTQQLYLEIAQKQTPAKILLLESEPVKFLAGFIAACAAECLVFLGNPHWVEQEKQQVFELVQPDIVLGDRDGEISRNYAANSPATPNSNWIMIPTGGTSGKIRFAIHTWETLTASVTAFRQYFDLQQINSFCTLPLYHVSGLMQFMRSLITGGKLAICQLKQIENQELSKIEPEEFYISLVPTQLQKLLQNPTSTAWLAQFRTVLLGGAPAWQELLETARKNRIKIAITYGMTETASGIAILKPQDFLKGENNSGQPLPHTQITICSDTGEQLAPNQIGNITITSKSLALGYYPEQFKSRDKFQLDDIGYIDQKGHLNIVGRSSRKIITGGENVYPEEIETAIRATNLVKDICIIGVEDSTWGQAVTAVYVKSQPNITPNTIQTAIKDKLSKFKQPKHWISLDTLPRNPQGKLNYSYITQIATNTIKATISTN